MANSRSSTLTATRLAMNLISFFNWRRIARARADIVDSDPELDERQQNHLHDAPAMPQHDAGQRKRIERLQESLPAGRRGAEVRLRRAAAVDIGVGAAVLEQPLGLLLELFFPRRRRFGVEHSPQVAFLEERERRDRALHAIEELRLHGRRARRQTRIERAKAVMVPPHQAAQKGHPPFPQGPLQLTAGEAIDLDQHQSRLRWTCLRSWKAPASGPTIRCG